MSAVLLEATGLRASYGAMEVLHGVSLRVEAGQIVGVLGANGAGKSTTLRVLAGLIRISAGVICLSGRPIAMLSVEERVEAGIALVTGGHDLFGSLTVLENLRIGAFTQRAGFQANCSEILDYFPVLRAKRHMRAASLSGGEGQMLAIGRALLSRPRLLLLDEPSQGLSPILVEQMFATIQRLARERDIGILLVEQSTMHALNIAAYCYVMEGGQIALGRPRGVTCRESKDRGALPWGIARILRSENISAGWPCG